MQVSTGMGDGDWPANIGTGVISCKVGSSRDLCHGGLKEPIPSSEDPTSVTSIIFGPPPAYSVAMAFVHTICVPTSFYFIITNGGLAPESFWRRTYIQRFLFKRWLRASRFKREIIYNRK